jgi:hydroxymethylbilane synthase
MGGSCSMPLAAYDVWEGEQLNIRAIWGDPEGAKPLAKAQRRGRADDLAAAVALGEAVARDLQAEVAGLHSVEP